MRRAPAGPSPSTITRLFALFTPIFKQFFAFQKYSFPGLLHTDGCFAPAGATFFLYAGKEGKAALKRAGEASPAPLRIPPCPSSSAAVGALPVMPVYSASTACRCRSCADMVSAAPTGTLPVRLRLHLDTRSPGKSTAQPLAALPLYGCGVPLWPLQGERTRRGEMSSRFSRRSPA